MCIKLCFLSVSQSFLSLHIASRNATETQDTDFLEWFAQILGRLLFAHLHPPGLMKSVDSQGSLSLLFMMKAIV
jgi:hypothetical protein